MNARLPMSIIGAGGGGKDGESGGSSPVESPDSLRSKQYARVIDLVSEGEIEGLVDGLKSVYLDGTPVQNADGSYNFKDVSLVTRNGTQAQSSIPGFPAVESEHAVGAEIKASQPVVRSITNVNADAMRVTISTPQLTFQNTETGDLTGTSVTLQIDTQSNGGGWVPYAVGKKWDTSAIVLDAAAFRVWQGAQKYGIGIRVRANLGYPDPNWVYGEGSYGTQPTIYGSIAFEVQYRAIGAGGWTTLASYTLAGADVTFESKGGLDEYTGQPIQTAIMPERTYRTAELTLDDYEMRVVRTGGTGPTTLTVLGGESYSLDFDLVITGKTTTRYQRSIRVELAGSAPWDVRVRRITADSTQSNLRNQTWWDSYTDLIDARLRWPNSALMALSIDAAQFRSIPSRGYRIKGIRLRLPSNYDPHDRTYTGSWDGTFQVAWSNNPAWVFYDLVTNDRYGLGEFIDEAQVDKWTLYEIAQYCDELVPDGFGGMEPRFTCNLYLQTREEAYRVINNLASIFRGIVFWSAGAITAVQDAPADPVMHFTAANVIDGRFGYQGSARKTRHTVALVSWNDPADHCRQKIEYVEDEEGIARYGIQQIELVGFGCTSRSLAHRIGKWLLYSERMETETVTFRAGLDGTFCWPGAVIRTLDPARAGKRHGGRVVSATTGTATLDAAVTIEAGKTYTLNVILPDGTQESRAVTTGAGTTATLSVTPDFTTPPQAQSVWTLTVSDLVPETWRALAITEVDKTQYEITALTHRPDKFAAIEQGLVLEPVQSSGTIVTPIPVSGITFTESLYPLSDGTAAARVTVGWLASPGAVRYRVRWQRDTENPFDLITGQASVDIDNALTGAYAVTIWAINALGVQSAPAEASAEILGLSEPPADVTGFAINILGDTAYLSWQPVADIDLSHYRIRFAGIVTGATWGSAIDLVTQVAKPATSISVPALVGTYLIKAVDYGGYESGNAALIVSGVAGLQGFNAVETLTEDPAFSGAHVDTVVISNTLRLDSVDQMADWPALTDVISLRYGVNGMAPVGTYTFDGEVDLGAVYVSRLTATLVASANRITNVMAAWTTLDSVANLAGVDEADWTVTIEMRMTDDDPAGTPVWSAWQTFIVGDYSARAFQFRAVLASNSSDVSPIVEQLSVTVDMPDRVAGAYDIACPAGGMTVVFAPAFKARPSIAVSGQDMATGDYVAVSSQGPDGFDIRFYNSGNAGVARTFDWVAKGYGYVN